MSKKNMATVSHKDQSPSDLNQESSQNKTKNIKIEDQIFKLEDHCFNELFSAERVKLFGKKEEYERHLEFCKEIFQRIHLIEVLLRNKIDCVLKRAINTHQSSLFTSEEWLFDLLSLDTKNISQKIKASILKEMDKITLIPKNLKGLSSLSNIKEPNIAKIAFDALLPVLGGLNNKEEIHSTLISKLNLGTWRNIIAIAHEIDEHFFGGQTNLKQDIFPKLYNDFSSSNGDFESFFDPVCHKNIAKVPLDGKIVIFVSCFTPLRNRMFHWEYLFKYDKNGQYSRIQTPFGSSKFSLIADEYNIEKYLERLLEAIL